MLEVNIRLPVKLMIDKPEDVKTSRESDECEVRVI